MFKPLFKQTRWKQSKTLPVEATCNCLGEKCRYTNDSNTKQSLLSAQECQRALTAWRPRGDFMEEVAFRGDPKVIGNLDRQRQKGIILQTENRVRPKVCVYLLNAMCMYRRQYLSDLEREIKLKVETETSSQNLYAHYRSLDFYSQASVE